MSKLTNISLAVAALSVIAVGSASAAPDPVEKVVANVPFPFIVGDSRLPAGHYVVEELLPDDPGTLLIAGADGGRQHVFSLSVPLSPADLSVKPTLVFEKFSNQFFLEKVVPEDGTAREIVLTPAIMEHELAATGAQR